MKSITAEDISKTYRRGKESITALHPVSFSVDRGELFGCIGPDGAGKTSLIRILATLLLPDSGKATVDGLDIHRDLAAIRKRVGYMPGRFSLYQDLSVEENLRFFATIFNTTVEKNQHLIRDIYAQLAPFAHRPAGKLSGGMKQKLALCCALIHEPSVLFLDEPTTGVDAVSRKEFWEMLHTLRQRGITILVSTPYMDEAGRCDRVALVQDGRFLRVDTPQRLTHQYPKRVLAVKGEDMYLLLQTLKQEASVEIAYPFGEYHHVVIADDVPMDGAYWQKFGVREVQRIEPDIEDCFILEMHQRQTNT
jgi:ABC-type multidrug transport system ATPase subunit